MRESGAITGSVGKLTLRLPEQKGLGGLAAGIGSTNQDVDGDSSRSKYLSFTRESDFFGVYQDELIMSHPNVVALQKGLRIVLKLRALVSQGTFSSHDTANDASGFVMSAEESPAFGISLETYEEIKQHLVFNVERALSNDNAADEASSNSKAGYSTGTIPNTTNATSTENSNAQLLHEVFTTEYKLIQDEVNDRILQSRLLEALGSDRITLVNSGMRNSKRNLSAVRPPPPKTRKMTNKRTGGCSNL